MGYTEELLADSVMVSYAKSAIYDSISVKEQLLGSEQQLFELAEIGRRVYKAVTSGKKVLICGNGGSAADAQHIAAEFVGRFVLERRGLAAIALTTDTSILTAVGNDYGFDTVFERQVEALGQEGDILIGITTSGNSANVLSAIKKANSMGLVTVGLLGGSGGEAAHICDYSIVIKSKVTARIQESHILCGHIICGMVDELMTRNKVNKAVFLDRDNTITVDRGYTHMVEDLEFIDGAVEALALLQNVGFKLVVVTNQSGVGRKLYSREEAKLFSDAMVEALKEQGVVISDVQMCTHTPEDYCFCRKPSPYMIDYAAETLNIDIAQSYMLGDKISDVKCGENAGVKSSYLVTEEQNLLYWAKEIIAETENQ